MAEPISQVEIESEILRLSGLCERVTHEIAKRAMAAAHADADYRKAHAQAYLLAEGTVGVREATSDLECADENLARKIADAQLMAATEAGRNYRAQLDSLRTLAANQRALVTGG